MLLSSIFYVLSLVSVGRLGQSSKQPRGPRQARRSGQTGQRNTLADRVLPQTSLPQTQEEGTAHEDSGEAARMFSIRSSGIVFLTSLSSSRVYQRTSKSPSPILLSSCWRGSMSRYLFILVLFQLHLFYLL